MQNQAHVFITSEYGAKNQAFNYLLGFQPSLGGMVLDNKNKVLNVILDGRYFEKIKSINEKNLKDRVGIDGLKINYINSQKTVEEIIKIINDETKKITKIILEGNIAVADYFEIKESTEKSVEANRKLFFTDKRAVKDLAEKEKIKEGIEIIDKVFEHIENLNKNGELKGKTELQVRGIIISKIFEFGGSGESFPAIVAFGKNSAIPHHETGKTIIGDGVLLIDMGALFEGYCSDFTRTIWVGEKNEEYQKFKEIYKIVKEAHELAFKGGKEGMTGKEIHAFTREYINKSGYGEFYVHGTGHGVGLDIHESPTINKSSKDIIKNNMFLTIEPGIYLPGKFGIRLEDITYMENGILKKYTKTKI